MIAKTLVFVCATVGLVAGSCFEISAPQECSSSQFVSIPTQTQSCFSAPIVSDNVCSTGSSNIVSPPCSASFVGDNLCSGLSSSPVLSCSSPVVLDNVYNSPCSSGSSFSLPVVSSGNSFSDVFSGSASGLQPGNGPETSMPPVIQAPSVTLPAIEGPTVTLSSPPIPAPRVLSQRCICTKTIVKPQVIQRTVTVPRLQRYVKRTVTPVVENVAYKSTPISQGYSGSSSAVVLSSGSVSSSPISFSSGSGSCGCQSNIVSAPVSFSSGSGSCGCQSNIISAPISFSSCGSNSCGCQSSIVSAPVVVSSGSGSCGCQSNIVCAPSIVSSGSSCPRYC